MVGVATTVWLIVGSLLICGLLMWAVWHFYKENETLKRAMEGKKARKEKPVPSSPDPMSLY